MSKYSQIVRFIREIYQKEDDFIPLHEPLFAGNEKKYLEACVDSTFVSSVGEFVHDFEVKIAEYTGSKEAVACVNGTNALHLALILCGVGQNSEVITQPLTFVATANAIRYCGAFPVFVDIDSDTLGMSPEALRKWLSTSTTKQFDSRTNEYRTVNIRTGRIVSACVPVHTFGFPCRIDEIVSICNEFEVPVIEDAAESLGSFYRDQHTGCFGKIGVLSFNGNKIITTGGGGMLLFQDENLAKKAKHLTTQAKVNHPWEFLHDDVGFNYRMPNINAALGLAQIEQINRFIESKRYIASAYRSFFSDIGICYISEPEHSISNYWLNCILFDGKAERDRFLQYTNNHGVMTRPVWKLLNELEMFRNCEANCLRNAIYVSERLVNIPSSALP